MSARSNEASLRIMKITQHHGHLPNKIKFYVYVVQFPILFPIFEEIVRVFLISFTKVANRYVI